MRFLRCFWRLLRVSLHLLHGLAIVLRRFEVMAPAARAEAILWWSRKLLAVSGVSLDAQGAVPPGARLIAANHISWLDIMALHAVCPQARFVSKADVHHWPVIGRLVAGAGTLFIERERKRDALRVVHHAAEAMRAGEVVAIFPEGTTGAGHALLPFHANLFQAAISAQVPVQPVLLRFSEPGHAISPAAAFIGETTLLESVWRLLSAHGVTAHVTVLEAVPVEGLDRRALSEAVQARLAAPLAAAQGTAAQDTAVPAAPR